MIPGPFDTVNSKSPVFDKRTIASPISVALAVRYMSWPVLVAIPQPARRIDAVRRMRNLLGKNKRSHNAKTCSHGPMGQGSHDNASDSVNGDSGGRYMDWEAREMACLSGSERVTRPSL